LKSSTAVGEGKKKWGWYRFVEVLQFLLSPVIPTKRDPLTAISHHCYIVGGLKGWEIPRRLSRKFF
jgi:hypothetical protein